MEDSMILDLFFQRSEQAIAETDIKYGSYCYAIAYNILASHEDSQECVSDTYLAAWNAIPPKRPKLFHAFLGKLTRHISLDRWRKCNAKKRGGGELPVALEELEACTSSENTETAFARKELTRALNRFLSALPETERNIFLCRYWYLDSIESIARFSGFSQSKVTSMLHRTRGKLRKTLYEEGLL
ncbi:MAG: sigma-70 family RNA polymerase sigma factor [Oscillospiraceae bacterium]|nr:sigma-70 family RNA polymerase sigma factor [Oscillospiraceae bacterium]